MHGSRKYIRRLEIYLKLNQSFSYSVKSTPTGRGPSDFKGISNKIFLLFILSLASRSKDVLIKSTKNIVLFPYKPETCLLFFPIQMSHSLDTTSTSLITHLLVYGDRPLL